MSNSGFVRVSVPKGIKAGQIIRVRALVVHPMEGVERSKSGEVMKRNYNFVYKGTVTFNNKTVLTIAPTQSISENPYFSFPLKIDSGGELKIVFEDTNGAQHVGVKQIGLG